MSALVFPDLQGLDIAVERTVEYDTTVRRAVSGKEYRTAWSSTPTYRYRLKFNVLREDVNAPSPNEAHNEVSVLLAWAETHKGKYEDFLFLDKYDNVQRRVRFEDDSLTIQQVAQDMWQCELSLVSVK